MLDKIMDMLAGLGKEGEEKRQSYYESMRQHQLQQEINAGISAAQQQLHQIYQQQAPLPITNNDMPNKFNNLTNVIEGSCVEVK